MSAEEKREELRETLMSYGGCGCCSDTSFSEAFAAVEAFVLAAQVQAWDEGYESGRFDVSIAVDGVQFWSDNPYRSEGGPADG